MSTVLTLIPSLAMLALAAGAPPIPTFTERTDAAGLTLVHTSAIEPFEVEEKMFMTPGVAVGDIDRDGDLDLYVPGGTGQAARLFLNDGTGGFSDAAAAWGVTLTAEEGACAAFADVNGDGWLDLYGGVLATDDHPGANVLFMNDHGRSFVDAGEASGAVLVDGKPFESFGLAFGDVDLDGDLDLASVDWSYWTQRNVVLLNDGTGVFTDATSALVAFDTRNDVRGFSPALVDLDGDRYPELTVAADFGTSVYHANARGRALDLLVATGTGTDENGMGSTFGDYDGDGDLDWFVTSIWDDDGSAEGFWGITGNRLYRNDGGHQFTDVTDDAGVREGDWGWGASFADLNNDGWLDLAMTNGFVNEEGENPDDTFKDDPTRVWIHGGDPKAVPVYTEVAAAAGIDHTGPGKALVAFDADMDGDLDLLITTNFGPMAYYRNDLDPAPNTWVEIDLAPPPGVAPDGIGAVVEVTANGVVHHRTVFGQPSFMSQEPLRAHVGFAPAASIDITVRWPNGAVTRRTDVAPGRVVRIGTADLDRDGAIGMRDLLHLLAAWGPCTEPVVTCPADLDLDGTIGAADLDLLLDSWSK